MCVFAVISACFLLWLLVLRVSSILTMSLYFLETVEILRLRLKFFWRRFVAYLRLLKPLFVRTSLWWRVLRGDLSHASPLPVVPWVELGGGWGGWSLFPGSTKTDLFLIPSYTAAIAFEVPAYGGAWPLSLVLAASKTFES